MKFAEKRTPFGSSVLRLERPLVGLPESRETPGEIGERNGNQPTVMIIDGCGVR